MKPILKWQYEQICKCLLLIQGHGSNIECPCSSEGEMCLRKHYLELEALCEETSPICDDEEMKQRLFDLAKEVRELRAGEELKLCDKESQIDIDITDWSRNWRKQFEQASLVCDLAPADQILVKEIARMFKEEPRWCFGVKAVSKELGGLARSLGIAKDKSLKLKKKLEMPVNICRGQVEMFESTTGVLDPYGSRCRDPETGHWTYSEECGFEPAGITTTALGMDGLTRYEFEFKIVGLDKLIVSHDPFTFTPNPEYPKELQPRLRERAATKIQVEKIAANLEPDAVIQDFHVIDRGTPIVGQDLVVEAGNGRVMGMIRAAADYPDKYSNYKDRLKERAHDYGLNPKDVDSIENPVLIRVRITDVDRTTFTQEANQAATIAPSAIENARTDAQKITLGMLQELIVGENESLEDALRAPKNQAFAKRFLATLPENIQAALVDAQGYLNRDGVHRMAMAVFVSAFQGDPGLRLAEKAFESVSMDVRNTVNAIARSLGTMAQAEALTRSGDRDTSLSIGDDLAQTINVYSAIKRNPALTVEKYLAQEQIFARELTPFQEKILVVLEEYKGSPKKLASIFTAYAEGVIKAPPPAQVALIPGVEITKEGLWESAVKAPELQPAFMEVIRMFEETCERPSAKYQHLSAFFTESPIEAALFATEPGETERKIDTVLAKLESGIAEIHESSRFKDFIDTMSKFHAYSLGNIMLITLQKPSASKVAGYRTWQDLGRNVREGEHGIMILAPCFPPKPKKEEEDEEEIEPEREPIYFKVVHVFDIGQTEGKELPTIEAPIITGDETGPLFQEASIYVAKQGITLDSQPRPGLEPDLMGFWSKPNNLIWIRPDAPQDQRTKTLLHEIAHAMCAMRGARDAEVMAESVAYTVANHFGFDTGVRSFPYVAVWARDVKVLKGNLEIIRKVAKDMIEGIEHVSELAEVAKMFEKARVEDTTKEDYIRSIVNSEIWLGKLKIDRATVEERARELAKLDKIALEHEYRLLQRERYGVGKEVDKAVYVAIGKPIPAYLHQSALSGIGAATITGIGIGAGFKFIDWLTKKFSEKGTELGAPMKLLTKEIRDKLPPLYSQEKVADPMVWVKFFTPDSNWTWYATEFDGEDRFFGWVVGFEKELGYFSLSELESARGPLGLPIERDKWFTPQPLSEVKKLHAHERGEMEQSKIWAHNPRPNEWYIYEEIGTGKDATTHTLAFVRTKQEAEWMLLGIKASRAQKGAKLKGGEMENSNTPAGFPLDPRNETSQDIKRFYAWTDRANPDDILGELCTRADYLGAQLCIAKEGDDVDKEWIEKCPYIGTEDVYSELGRLRFLCYKLTEKLPGSVTILGEGELADKPRFCLSEDDWFELQDAISKGEKQKAVEIMWSKGMKLVLAPMMTEASPYARQIPDYVDIFKKTIAKHYRPTEDFHEGSLRVVKPEPDVLVYLGCLKSDDWDGGRCSPNPTVVKTIVPNTKEYRDELDHLKLVHPEVKINYRTKEVGVEPVVGEGEQQELEAVGEALEHAEEVE